MEQVARDDECDALAVEILDEPADLVDAVRVELVVVMLTVLVVPNAGGRPGSATLRMVIS